MGEFLRQILLWAIPILGAIILHEVAHGWVAYRLGDPTAARMGRLTLNPISHIDLVGTILIPIMLIVARSPFLFGYAKPVPVNFSNLKRPKRDMICVSLAGPVTNIILALISLLVLKFIISMSISTTSEGMMYFVIQPIATMAVKSVTINVALGVFNLFPLPPLDGGRVIVGLLPEPYSSTVSQIEPYGFIILILLLMTGVLDFFINPIIRFILNLLQAMI